MKKNLLPVVLVAGLVVLGVFLYNQDASKIETVNIFSLPIALKLLLIQLTILWDGLISKVCPINGWDIFFSKISFISTDLERMSNFENWLLSNTTLSIFSIGWHEKINKNNKAEIIFFITNQEL